MFEFQRCCCWCAAHYTPTQLLLLANHHSTLLYLGHGNVLLLSPLADTLCCNLPKKIGWGKRMWKRETHINLNLLFFFVCFSVILFLRSSGFKAVLFLFIYQSTLSPLWAVKGLHTESHLPTNLCPFPTRIHELIHTVPMSSIKSS